MKDNKDFFTKTWVVWLGALLCCALWGSAFPCIKIGYAWMEIDSGDTVTQILYAGIRFFLAGILAVTIGSLLQKKFIYPSREARSKVLFLCLFQTVLQYFFFYVGLAHTTGVKASIVEGTNVFVAIIVAGAIFKQEKITGRKIMGCIVGFLGVIIVNYSGSGIEGLVGDLSLTGEGFIFLSTFAYAFSSVLLKRYSKTENPVMLSGYQFIFGGLIMGVAGFALGGRINHFSGKALAMLLWLAVVSAVAYSLWGVLLKHNSISRVAVFGFMNPVFGVILSAWLLREAGSLGVKCLLALALVCVGIFVVNHSKE